MSEKPEVVPAKGTPKNRIVHPRTELRWPPFHSNLLSEEFLDEVKAVFDEMLGRLYYGADKRRGWATAEPWKELTEHECRTCIRDSIAKGKLIDAMNYLMFAHLNCHKILTLRNQSLDSQIRDQLAKALGVAGRSWDEILAMVGTVKAQAVGHEKTIEAVAKELKLDPDAPADTIISTVHFLVKRCQQAVTEVDITGCTDPETLENVAKMMKANNQSAAFAWDGRPRPSCTWPRRPADPYTRYALQTASHAPARAPRSSARSRGCAFVRRSISWPQPYHPSPAFVTRPRATDGLPSYPAHSPFTAARPSCMMPP